jgi:DNA-binding transcriptional MerR regulator
MRISELSAKTQVSVHRLRRYEADGLIESQRLPNGYRAYDEKTMKHVIFKAGKLSAQDMIDAILARVAEIDQLISEQQTLRQKLMDHIGWFKTQARRKP